MVDESRRRQYLEAMGVQLWLSRRAASTPNVEEPAVPFTGEPCTTVEETVVSAEQKWRQLEAGVKQCTACELHRQRTQTVFGVGSHRAKWMIIGEAPGADEDRQGEPFVGRAGKLLNAMLLALGFQREHVYITNIVKCRPPQNRDPRPDETAQCAAYLRQQIALIKPKIILAIGRVAAQNLLNTDISLGRLRGQVHRYGDTHIPVVVTYHPAYLLRSPLEKRKAWQDLQYAMSVFRQSLED